MTSMSCKLEPAIWSHDTGQQIPYFDRCQLIITWMSDIKEVPVNQGCISLSIYYWSMAAMLRDSTAIAVVVVVSKESRSAKFYLESKIALFMPAFCRFAYWLTLFHLFDNVKNVDIVLAIKTDHSAITIEFQSIDQQLKGPGSWKLNASLLFKKDSIEEMEFNIPILRNESISFFQDQQMSWEWIKYRIHEFSINFSKRIASQSKKEELVLPEKIDESKSLHESNPSNETLNILDNAIADLDSYEEKKVVKR